MWHFKPPQHDDVRKVFALGWQTMVELTSAEGLWTSESKRQHLRYYLCGKLKAEGRDPVELSPVIIAVVVELMKP